MLKKNTGWGCAIRRVGRDRRIIGLATCQPGSRFNERLCLKRVRWRGISRTLDVLLWDLEVYAWKTFRLNLGAMCVIFLCGHQECMSFKGSRKNSYSKERYTSIYLGDVSSR